MLTPSVAMWAASDSSAREPAAKAVTTSTTTNTAVKTKASHNRPTLCAAVRRMASEWSCPPACAWGCAVTWSLSPQVGRCSGRHAIMRIMLNSRDADRVLEAEGISFAYGHEPVLSGVNLAVRAGEFAALAGPNGSGKSTLLRIALGLLRPDAGTVKLFGAPPRDLRDRWRIGYVPQRLRIAPDLPATVEEVVSAGRLAKQGWWRRSRARDREAVDHALDSVALSAYRRRRMGELSGGEQQRALIAKALAADPQLLVLDEPIAGVGVDSQRTLRDSLVYILR